MEQSAFDAPYRGGMLGPTHRFALSVYFEDTDSAGVVYYANYLKYMERARSDMLRHLGIDQRSSLEAGAGVYVVADVAIRYLRPARLGDDLLVVTGIEAIRAASIHIHQAVMRAGETLTEALLTAAFVGADGRPRRQPPEWIAIFRQLKQQEG